MKRFLVATSLAVGLVVATAPAVSAQPMPARPVLQSTACHWYQPECWPTYNWLYWHLL